MILVQIIALCMLPIGHSEMMAARCDSPPNVDSRVMNEDVRSGEVISYNTSILLTIKPCQCIYYDTNLKSFIVGSCLFTCTLIESCHLEVSNTSELNHLMCDKFHRMRRFCGQCQEGYGLAAYSYHYISCIPCKHYGYKNWIRYFTIALLPLTVFYILVILLKFNATTSRLNGWIMITQCATVPVQMRIINEALTNTSSFNLLYIKNYIKFLTVFTGVTNLDFFRTIYRPFCLHPRANILHVLSLDYIVAFYPFVLILLTYMLVTIYDKHYRILVWMWKPFKWCLSHYQRQWNIKTSLIEVFATFVLLSYIKIISVSCDLLAATRSYDIHGNRLNKLYLYYDANIEYFGRQHLPFAILALFTGLVFVILPFLILVLYPCRCFQRGLNYMGWRCQTLHIIMDAFQGSYKIEPYDLRYFSAYYLLLRMMTIAQMLIYPNSFYLYTSAVVFLFSAMIFTAFHPYKTTSHNKIDIIMMLVMTLYFASYYINVTLASSVAVSFQGISIVILVLYSISLLSWKVMGSKVKTMIRKIKFCIAKIKSRNDLDQLQIFT